MSISTFLKGLYNKYVLAKPPVKEPVITKTPPTGPRVRTTHVITDPPPPKTTPATTTTVATPKTTATAITTPAVAATQKPATKTKATTKTTPPPAEPVSPPPPVITTTAPIIYPVIKLATDSALEEPGVITSKWLGDLMICYTADNTQLLQHKDLPAGMTLEKLHETAVTNLGKNIEYSLKETSFGGYELVAGGQYEASAVCLPGIWQWLTEQFVDSLLVVVPAKDLVLVIPEQDSHGMYHLQATVKQAFKNNSQPLTANIFRYNRYSQQWSVIGSAQ